MVLESFHWLAETPRAEIRKTVDASFCGTAQMVSTLFMHIQVYVVSKLSKQTVQAFLEELSQLSY